MNDKTTEWLVVLDPERAEEMRAQLIAYGRVTQAVSPSVVILSGIGDFCTGDLAGVEGVVAVADQELPAEVLEQLDANEAMWARAWAERRRPKQRPGDGLTWDAEGFREMATPAARFLLPA